MATRVEIDFSLPIGSGPDGHVALHIEIDDLAKVSTPDQRYIIALVEKLAEIPPVPVPREELDAIGRAMRGRFEPPVIRPSAIT